MSVAALLRETMRGLVAPVVVVSTASTQGERLAMTATSFTSVSMEPPAVLVCIRREAGIHDALLASGQFCINVLAAGHEVLAQVCAGASDGKQRFGHAAWRQDGDGLPYLSDAKAVLMCRVKGAPELGTHTVVLGEVRRASVSADAPALLYTAGRYCTSENYGPRPPDAQ